MKIKINELTEQSRHFFIVSKSVNMKYKEETMTNSGKDMKWH